MLVVFPLHLVRDIPVSVLVHLEGDVRFELLPTTTMDILGLPNQLLCDSVSQIGDKGNGAGVNLLKVIGQPEGQILGTVLLQSCRTEIQVKLAV